MNDAAEQEIKTTDAGKFLRDSGLLFKINKSILHPLGLAMMVDIDDETKEEKISNRLWDYRDDPEGILYDPDALVSGEAKLKAFYDSFGNAKMQQRYETLGFVEQKLDGLDETETGDFGEAIKWLKTGHKVARTGWNGKGMFLFMIKGDTIAPAIESCYGDGTLKPKKPVGCCIAMKTAQDTIVVGWLASQTDMLSEDWVIVE